MYSHSGEQIDDTSKYQSLKSPETGFLHIGICLKAASTLFTLNPFFSIQFSTLWIIYEYFSLKMRGLGFCYLYSAMVGGFPILANIGVQSTPIKISTFLCSQTKNWTDI